ncbi:hypothetical protein [Pseudooceanicola sp. C21-150M6]|uniref:hypothetical protein n=1 Tax=Pseudooceanicola sp. C21-150M6 TaxID=3434355 RepID=UPI003D7F7503
MTDFFAFLETISSLETHDPVICNSRMNLMGRGQMLRTITVGSCVSVQGTFVRTLNDGRVEVRVGNQVFSGVPVSSAAAA